MHGIKVTETDLLDELGMRLGELNEVGDDGEEVFVGILSEEQVISDKRGREDMQECSHLASGTVTDLHIHPVDERAP